MYDSLAEKYQISREAVETLAEAIQRGQGKAAQFNHPELGGMGQWMPGLIMIGDMMNHTLKARVDQLCRELAAQYVNRAEPSGQMTPITGSGWWPSTLGEPAMNGSQDDWQYAYFPRHHLLIIKRDGLTTTYDVTGHKITGVSQQQSNRHGTLTFNTDTGTLAESELKPVE